MLVLERKYKQAIKLILPNGREIKVKIVKTDKNRVKLGIDAPREVVVEREELRYS